MSVKSTARVVWRSHICCYRKCSCCVFLSALAFGLEREERVRQNGGRGEKSAQLAAHSFLCPPLFLSSLQAAKLDPFILLARAPLHISQELKASHYEKRDDAENKKAAPRSRSLQRSTKRITCKEEESKSRKKGNATDS